MVLKEISKKVNPESLKEKIYLTEEELSRKKVRDGELKAILSGEDDRLLLVMGPCSSDNEEAVLEYAQRLSKLQEKVKDKIFIVMRVYTAKPRTNGDGYKGIIHETEAGISAMEAGRSLHAKVIKASNLSIADELLYPENLPYIDDLISYFAIGARSVENQQHRFVASGIECPVGLKNPTSGSINVMLNGIYAAQKGHTFLYRDQEVETSGNKFAHAILRGSIDEEGFSHPNYSLENLLKVRRKYEEMALENPTILIDTNHDNSGKNYRKQIDIVEDVLKSRNYDYEMKKLVKGFMIESYLEDGRQESPQVFGKSITDPCLGWNKTEELVEKIYIQK